MLSVESMKEDADEELSFVSLAALTAKVVRFLQMDHEKDEEGDGNGETTDADEKKRRDHREYIEGRLRELAAWERHISDTKNRLSRHRRK